MSVDVGAGRRFRVRKASDLEVGAGLYKTGGEGGKEEEHGWSKNWSLNSERGQIDGKCPMA